MNKKQERTLTLIETTKNSDVLLGFIESLDSFQLNCLDIWVDEFQKLYKAAKNLPSSDKVTFQTQTNIGKYSINVTISNVSDITVMNEMEGKVEVVIIFYKNAECILAARGSGKKLRGGLISEEVKELMDIIKTAIKENKKSKSFIFNLLSKKEKYEEPEYYDYDN